MNNDLEQFSEEMLKKMIFLEGSGCVVYKANEVAALARIVLAAKQATPVGYAIRDENYNWYIDFCGKPHELQQGESLYTTPPANSPEIPDGWKLVPIEPTEAMKKAYYDSSLAPISKLSVTGYRALIAAAPKPESE